MRNDGFLTDKRGNSHKLGMLCFIVYFRNIFKLSYNEVMHIHLHSSCCILRSALLQALSRLCSVTFARGKLVNWFAYSVVT